jgi:hypothetical protein
VEEERKGGSKGGRISKEVRVKNEKKLKKIRNIVK